MKAIPTIGELKSCCNQLLQQRDSNWQYYNYWPSVRPEADLYWFRFMKARGILQNKKVAMFSCFGPRYLVHIVKADFKIFKSGENLKRDNYLEYADHCLTNHDVDLAMGYEHFSHSRYVRFPIWINYMFEQENIDAEYIRRCCERIRFPNTSSNREYAAMVVSNPEPLRKNIFNGLNTISEVKSAGKFMHNDDRLFSQFHDSKVDYLKQFVFNICPENSKAYGYVTEKLFEAISVGSIPIYWGEPDPEPNVINKDAIIYWNPKDHGTSALRQVTELWNNEKLRKEFMAQPRLLPTAEEFILDTFAKIERIMLTADKK